MTAIRQIQYAAVALAGAAVLLTACSDPASEPSALADEAYAVLDALTTQYSPRDAGSVQETRAALHLRDRLNDIGYDTSIKQFGTSYTHEFSYMFYTDPPLESGGAGLRWILSDRICTTAHLSARREATSPGW